MNGRFCRSHYDALPWDIYGQVLLQVPGTAYITLHHATRKVAILKIVHSSRRRTPGAINRPHNIVSPEKMGKVLRGLGSSFRLWRARGMVARKSFELRDPSPNYRPFGVEDAKTGSRREGRDKAAGGARRSDFRRRHAWLISFLGVAPPSDMHGIGCRMRGPAWRGASTLKIHTRPEQTSPAHRGIDKEDGPDVDSRV